MTASSSLRHAVASSTPLVASVPSWQRSGSIIRNGARILLAEHVRHSHIGKAPVIVPSTTSLSILPFAPVSNPSRRQPTALTQARSVRVQGPLGTVLVPLHKFVNVAWDLGKGQTRALDGASSGISVASSSAPQTASPSSSSSSAPAEIQRLVLGIDDASSKLQRGMWGLTRALLANAIEGVQEGHSAVLRLVGVGYRAAVETDPFPRPDKFDVAFGTQQTSTGSAPAAEANLASTQQLAYYSDLVRSTAAEKAERKRLTLRLGFAHAVNLTIPRGLTCSTPAPTRIVIKGIDKELVGLFAAQIRRYRPPEPYKGKGVFVGDETIRLKSPRKK